MAQAFVLGSPPCARQRLPEAELSAVEQGCLGDLTDAAIFAGFEGVQRFLAGH